MKNINIPELSLITLIGPSGAGKSTFAKKYFPSTAIVSSDSCRAMIMDDEMSLEATSDAFDLVHTIVDKRLKNGLLTVVDATNTQKMARKPYLALAKKHHFFSVAIVLDLPEKLCKAHNAERADRKVPNYVITQQKNQLKGIVKQLKKEGYRFVFVFKSLKDLEKLETIVKMPLYNNKEKETGSFDIIGDVHGCYDELVELLTKMDYQINTADNDYGVEVIPPKGRKTLFVGDLVDRGPKVVEVLKLVMQMTKTGNAFCVSGNHDSKLLRKLNGRNVQIKHGLAETLEQLEGESSEFIEKLKVFLDGLISHYVLDKGNLVIAHAGIKESMIGRGSRAIREFCMYGETTGETDEFGLPVRCNWATTYRGKAIVVYGHSPVMESEWLNNTINVDTGCVFGGKLTALRYPEQTLMSVDALRGYCEPSRPLQKVETALTLQQEEDELLDVNAVVGKQLVETTLRKKVTIPAENTYASLEILSRWAVNPKWLIYLPPTMSPPDVSVLPNYLEHPKEAFEYYRKNGAKKLICEEKHMGSRVVIVLAKNEEAVQKHFGIVGEGIGVCYTRSGRNFFTDKELENDFLEKLKDILTKSKTWERLNSSWICLDAELMPWSLKAEELIKVQYAGTGSAASVALSKTEIVLKKTLNRDLEGVESLLNRVATQKRLVDDYINAYQKYCWETDGLEDFRLAPFHILATEGMVHMDKSHEWHMQEIEKMHKVEPSWLVKTNYKVVDLEQEESCQQAIEWWTDLTNKGGEGMVIKPINFILFGKKGLIQPALKCRGKSYLRIIYGATYDLPQNLKVLKNRNVAKKRSLALREFALGHQALTHFITKEPLRKTHQCVAAVLALESEVLDPRL